MALAVKPTSTSTIAKSTSSQLDTQQVLRASKALVKKLHSSSTSTDSKTNLLADADEDDSSDIVPVWLILTTKKHVVDKKRLKPGKITLPHPYIRSEQTSAEGPRVCLITADPQRKYKDLIAHPSFPAETSRVITRVIGLEKLKAKYNSYENKRQLLSEYDVFLADDRIITYLPALLGKVFYKSTSKRPVPVTLEGRRQNFDEQGNKRRKLAEGGTKVTRSEVKPTDIAAEIEKALSSALVHLAPSTTTAVKVGTATMSAEHIQDNIEAVVAGLVETYVPQKWKNVRAIHIKGPNTIALPIWLTEELWTDEKEDIRDEPLPIPGKSEKKRKRSALTNGEDVIEVPGPDGKMRQVKKPTTSEDNNDSTKAEQAVRKAALKKQKADLIREEVSTTKPVRKTRMTAADLN